ncbi:MAG: FHA domain-containing protein, partial [Planctomycetota bacterium]
MLNQPEIKVLPVNFYLVNATGRSIQLHPGRSYTIGREKDCDIRVVDTLLSREHCRFDWCVDTYSWSLQDLRSRNGTYVNDVELLKPRLLKDRDRIRLGGQLLTLYYVKLGDSTEAVAAESQAYRNQATLALIDACQRQREKPFSLAGTVATIPLPTLLTLLKTTRGSGRLEFDDNEQRSLWLIHGTPVHAMFDQQSGREAMTSLLDFTTTFAFLEGDHWPQAEVGNLENDPSEISL